MANLQGRARIQQGCISGLNGGSSARHLIVLFLLSALVSCLCLQLEAQETQAVSVAQPVNSEGDVVPKAPHSSSDNSFSYFYGPNYRTPFITTPAQPQGADIVRNTIQFKHQDSWAYGTNLFTVDLRKSSSVETTAGGGGGALEAYAVIRSAFSFNRMAHTRTFAVGPLRDLAFELGANLETKNSTYAPEERTIYVGPNLQFKIPRGFFSVGLHFRKEWNHEGILGKDESYAASFNIEPTWAIPFRVGHLAMSFEGFADLNTPKGKDSFGTTSATELLVRPQLKLDLSSLLRAESQMLQLGIGLEYWHNEYGKPEAYIPGAKQLTPLFTVTLRLPHGHQGM